MGNRQCSEFFARCLHSAVLRLQLQFAVECWRMGKVERSEIRIRSCINLGMSHLKFRNCGPVNKVYHMAGIMGLFEELMGNPGVLCTCVGLSDDLMIHTF